MGDSKQLEKLIIRSFTDRQFKHEQSDLMFVAPINPETYTTNFKVSVDQQQGHGNEGTEIRYRSTAPEELRLDFILDGTNTMEGYSGKTSDYATRPVSKQLRDFLLCCYDMNGPIHRPNFVIVMWGQEFSFRCVLANADINYTLFEPDGSPLRVKISATFLHHKSREEILAEARPTSPDLTHIQRVKQGDRLDNLSFSTYDDPGFLTELANYNAGLITPAALLMPGLLWADKEKHAIGIQLYTLREMIAKDPKGVLDKIAAAGYTEIETFGYGAGKFFGMTVKEFAAYATSLGLSSPSGHYMPPKFLWGSPDEGKDELKDLIETAVTMKHEYLIIPYLPAEKRTSLDDYKKLAAKFNAAGELAKKGGIQLGYHNHDFEFKDYGGTSGYDILTKETDENLVKFEIDLYWTVFAGKDPHQLIEKMKGRVPLWHVKDMDKTDRTKQTEVGNGSIDYKGIFKFAKLSGLKHFYVEQENNYVPDPAGSIVTSARYIKSNLI